MPNLCLEKNFKKITLRYSSSRPNEVIKERKYDIAFFHTFKRVHLVNLLLITLTQNQIYARLLERTYKPHYESQNFSPLANGTDLNRQKCTILQTHWH